MYLFCINFDLAAKNLLEEASSPGAFEECLSHVAPVLFALVHWNCVHAIQHFLLQIFIFQVLHGLIVVISVQRVLHKSIKHLFLYGKVGGHSVVSNRNHRGRRDLSHIFPRNSVSRFRPCLTLKIF